MIPVDPSTPCGCTQPREEFIAEEVRARVRENVDATSEYDKVGSGSENLNPEL